MDDYGKVECDRAVRAQIVDSELHRLRGFVALLVDGTTYGAKRRRYVPALLSVRTGALLEAFLAAAQHDGIDVAWDAEAACCVVRIRAPRGSPAESAPRRRAQAPCTRPAPRRTASPAR